MPAVLGPVAGAVVGGLMGGDDEQTQTQNRDPWGPAQPWLRANLNTGQNLQGYYERHPFNQIQQTAYQNTLSDLDNYRQNINPGMMAFANRLMGTNYQRGQGGQRGGMQGQGMGGGQGQPMGQGQGMGQGGGGMDALFSAMMQDRGAPNATMGDMNAIVRGGGLLGSGAQLATGGSQMAPKTGGQQGPFTAAPGQMYGLIDWAQLNPFTATGGIEGTPATKTQAQLDEEARLAREKAAREAQQQTYYSPGDSGA
jgi:hypothetical protein